MSVHYIWYEKLYCGEKAAKSKSRLIHRLEKGKLEPDVFVLTLPESRERNILDIYRAATFKQPHFDGRDKYVVGIARGRDEAMDIVTKLVDGMYKSGNNFNIRDYLGFYESDYSDTVKGQGAFSSDTEV